MRFTRTKFKAAMAKPEPHWEETHCFAIQVPKWNMLKLCVHKELTEEGAGKKWVMSDMTTGLKISQFSWPTREGAIKDGLERLQKHGRDVVLENLEIRRKELPV
jgi:hypothetical protein